MKINKAPLDATGRRIEVGHIIAYPMRKGSQLWQNFGIVRDITYDGEVDHIDGTTFIHPIIHLDRNTIEIERIHTGLEQGWKKRSILMRTQTKNHHLAIIIPMSEKWYMHHFSIGEVIDDYLYPVEEGA